MSGSFDRYGEWVVRGADVVRELREDGGYCRSSYEEWAGAVQFMVCEAVEQGKRGEGLCRDLMQVYGAGLVVVEYKLLPAILVSPYRLLHGFALDVPEDLRSFWYGTDGGLVPEAIIGFPRPDYHCQDAVMWRDWLLGCCDWLCQRAEAHQLTGEVMAQGRSIAPDSGDQILVSCYGAALVVAASAAGWGTCAEVGAGPP